MFHQIYLQNCLLLLLAVYLFKAVVDPKLGKMVLNVIKAAQMKENQFVAVA